MMIRSFLTRAQSAPSLVLVQQRTLYSKVNRDPTRPPRPPPFPYEKRQFRYLDPLWDKSSLRFDENTKLIVVEGVHGVGKSQFAEELAQEFDMKYIPPPNHDVYYTNAYGQDLRDYKEFLTPKAAPWDDADFVRDPNGGPPGSCDRYHFRMFMMKFFRHIKCLRHILNTGQGVVTEMSPYSDYVLWDAAFNQGWIDTNSMKFHKKMLHQSLHWLLRPNLIIYLDAPIDVVQKKIAANGKECDKNSPLWSNTEYLEDVYGSMKRNYLREAQTHSEVLIYDWSEPGDMEAVVEDCEYLNLDHFSLYDKKQKDWRFTTDDVLAKFRHRYTSEYWLCTLRMEFNLVNFHDAKHLYYENDDVTSMDELRYWLKGRFAPGFNTDMGDKSVWFRTNTWQNVLEYDERELPIARFSMARPFWTKDLHI